MTPERFESIKQYVGFDDASSAALAAFHPVVSPHSRRIIDDFYDAIQRHPEAHDAITGGDEQVERLKKTLRGWIDEVLTGPHDDDFVERHARIGRVHVRINLPQQFMFTAMNRIRSQLVEVASNELHDDAEAFHRTTTAVNQILDLELAIMLDTYREDLVEKMRVRERLATVGQLSATIAHELRNPLGTVESSLFLIRKRMGKLGLEDAVLSKHYDKISGQVASCGTTIHNLLDLARDRPLKMQPVRLDQLVASAVESTALPEAIEVDITIPADLVVHGDADQLRQVVGNLLGNASDAMDGDGRIAVEGAKQTDGLALTVSDEGEGIPDHARRRIFDVLYTTKAAGTGLGLPLALLICQAHGGDLELVDSDMGARFRMTLPHPDPTAR